MIILALDALDLTMVHKYNCENLRQLEFGQTDISEFELARTVVLWASFLTGKNMETRIPVKTQWAFKLEVEDTFFSAFNNYKAIDTPAFSLKEKNHSEERKLLKAYFNEEATIEEYDAIVWKNHEENKVDFFNSMGKMDLIMVYFDLADAIGHLSFGIPEKMKNIYEELDVIAGEVKSSIDDNFILIISDHGMKSVGRYGDHTNKGFYSANRKLGFNIPNITDFYDLIRRIA